MKISILIPVYNEFPTFSQVLERVRQARLPDGCEKEIVVVDDGSTDGTGQVIREYSHAGLIVAHRSSTLDALGKGMAIRAGLRW